MNNLERKKYLVLINLGTPDSTSLWKIQKYLFEFLMDPCVIDIPIFSRLLLVGGVIVPFRSPNTRKSYKEIWTKKGSPLKVITKELVEKLTQKFQEQGDEREVVLAMRYGSPSIKALFQKIIKDNKDKQCLDVDFMPLYPHTALSTTVTVEREVKKNIKQFSHQLNRIGFTYNIFPSFYKHPDYIEALTRNIYSYLQEDFDYLLFSYHGIPERHLLNEDPTSSHCLKVENCCQVNEPLAHSHCYRHQVLITTKLIAEKLRLKPNQYSSSFQSRLGRAQWLTPYTDKTIIELAQQGVKKLLVVCPSFVSDNLETLFEISIENKKIFLEHGGEKLTLIPCLNTDEKWIKFIQNYTESMSPTN